MTDWKPQFQQLFERTLSRMRSGERSMDRLFSGPDRELLRSIGSKPIEMFDACEDFMNDGAPTFEESLQIHEIRCDYFLRVQSGVFPPLQTEYRPRDSSMGGIAWLPRAIDKARAKLEGRLIDDLYYPCGGDRHMLDELGIGRVDFFRIVRDHADDAGVLAEVQKRRKKRP